ncbi:MAG: acyl carrier protein [Xanthobacteraceae bacterium]|nr:acyl carrier protein [Xanthobacteraceae bacterium]
MTALIGKKLPPDKRNLQMADWLDEIGIDSLMAVEMIFDLEAKFDIQIPFNANDAKLEFETVGEIVAAIKKITGKS